MQAGGLEVLLSTSWFFKGDDAIIMQAGGAGINKLVFESLLTPLHLALTKVYIYWFKNDTKFSPVY